MIWVFAIALIVLCLSMVFRDVVDPDHEQLKTGAGLVAAVAMLFLLGVCMDIAWVYFVPVLF